MLYGGGGLRRLPRWLVLLVMVLLLVLRHSSVLCVRLGLSCSRRLRRVALLLGGGLVLVRLRLRMLPPPLVQQV